MKKAYRVEGHGAIKDLCLLAERIGYNSPYKQHYCDNGAAVSSFLDFLEDNPGCVTTIHSWINEHYQDQLSEPEEDDEEYADEEDEE